MDDMLTLKTMLEELIDEAKENLGSERVEPYVCILEGVLNGINLDLRSN